MLSIWDSIGVVQMDHCLDFERLDACWQRVFCVANFIRLWVNLRAMRGYKYVHSRTNGLRHCKEIQFPPV